MKQEFNTYINNLYKKLTYLDQYAASVILTSITLLIFFLIFSYYYTMSKIKPIRADWLNQRCSPAVIPFAGFINRDPDTSVFDFTAQNFHHCIVITIKSAIGMFLAPINELSNMMINIFKTLVKDIQNIRILFARIRNAIKEIVENIMHRITNILIQLQRITIVMKNILGAAQGTLVSALFTTLGSYLAMKSFFGAFLELLLLFLIVFAAIIILMWIFPWTWEIAIAMTAFFIILAVPTSIMAYWLNRILDLTSGSVPPTPGKCFDENTLIPLKVGMIPIKDVKVGDKLADGGKITSLIKCSTYGETLYNLNSIIVTGSHGIILDNNGWINVKNHPDSIEIKKYNKAFVYCINTSTKMIKIGNVRFADWDEVDKKDILELRWIMRKYLPRKFSTDHIHENLDGGFVKNTKIEMENGRLIHINDINVYDKLKHGERVLGIVCINGGDIKNIKNFRINNLMFSGGPNLRICGDGNLGDFSTLDMYGININYKGKLYHLITDTGFLTIDGIKFYDYNGCLEQILWKKEYICKQLKLQ